MHRDTGPLLALDSGDAMAVSYLSKQMVCACAMSVIGVRAL